MTPDSSDEGLRRAYRALLQRRQRAQGGAQLERMIDLVEGNGAEDERLATLDAVMADAEAAREFELLRALERARPAPVPAWRRPAVFAPVLAAAALVLVAVPALRQRQVEAPPETMRDVAEVPVLLAPPADASPAQASTFRWQGVPAARAYVLEILTASGRPLFTMRTTATAATLPADVVIAPGVEHWWWVAAELADGTQRRSPFRKLLVRQAR